MRADDQTKAAAKLKRLFEMASNLLAGQHFPITRLKKTIGTFPTEPNPESA